MKNFRLFLAALLLTFMSTFSSAVVDRAVCSASDSGGTSCTVAQLKSAINEEVNAVDARATMVLGSTSGTDTYLASVTPTLTAYADGQEFRFKPPNTNTGASTLNINSIGAKAIVTAAGVALAAGDLQSSTIYKLMYYSTSDQFRIELNASAVKGAASATDNAIARFDGTTGKLLQNSAPTIGDDGEMILEVGDTDDAPLKFQAGTNLTTAEVGALEMDANNIYGTTDAGNRGVMLLEHFIMLNANYTLTNSGAEQKLFDSTTNGRLTLEAGTYEFESTISISSMSATSGNGAFDILGAGGATLGTVLYEVNGIDGAVATVGSGSHLVNNAGQTPTNMVTAAVSTEMQATIKGMFRVTVGGTIVPSITLTTAAAAVVRNGSFFKCKRIGSSTVTNVGQWD